MDTEKEINSLAAETLAMTLILGNVLGFLAQDPKLRKRIVAAFDRAADNADTVAIKHGRLASPDHTVKAIRIVEEMRTMVLGPSKPKSS